jgi:5'-3' exonuclease
MQVDLVDGTYELFRYFFSPGGGHANSAGEQVGAVRGVLRSVLTLLEAESTHIAVATDHVVESFRNDLWEGYKTGEGTDPDLVAQFPLLEDALEAMGVAVLAMVDVEADDGLASAAAVAQADGRPTRIIIRTPDKDLAQCVVDPVVVQYDRKSDTFRDAAGVQEKYGVPPVAIPDWLALVGDAADGFPGLPGWGAKTAAAVLRRYGTIDEIPLDPSEWDVTGVRGAPRLAATLADQMDVAQLFRTLARVVTDSDVGEVDDWLWVGPTDQFENWCDRLDAPDLLRRANRLQAERNAPENPSG